jgi:surface carbohydrate biosynthesis protein (TIGR04326 family)
LVFCEWSSVGTSFVLSLLASTLAEADRPIDVAVKPHPGHMPGDAELAAVGGRLVDGHVDDLLADCDLVLVSNATSTALDVYIFGWPMVVSLSPSQLNLNDLRGDSDVEFISTSEELASFLSLEHPPPSPRLVRKYFDLDPELAAWRQILAQPDD